MSTFQNGAERPPLDVWRAPEASIPPIHINKRHMHRPGIVRGPTTRQGRAVTGFGCTGLPGCLNGHQVCISPIWMTWDAVLDLVAAGTYCQAGAAKISHNTHRSGCGASYDAGTVPVAFIYVYGRYTGLGCLPNAQGRALVSILESGFVFLNKIFKTNPYWYPTSRTVSYEALRNRM